MNGRIFLGAVLCVSALGLVLLGLLFLIASRSDGHRLPVGMAMLVAGLCLLAAGVTVFRQGIRQSPERIQQEILGLARRNHGEVSRETLDAALGSGDLVEQQVRALVERGVARQSSREGRRILVFPDYLLELVVKKCPFCGNDYPVRDEVEKCPGCGADLKISREKVSGPDDKVSI